MMSKYILPLILLLSIVQVVSAQNYTYTSPSGNLEVEVFVSNPCDENLDGTPDNNGFVRFTIVQADGGSAQIQILSGPVTKYDPLPAVMEGESYVFNPATNLPAGTYGWFIFDGAEGIGSVTDAANYPPIVLSGLAPLDITSSVTSNTSCSTPNGQISIDLTGGSQNLTGGGSYNYEITTDNGLFEPITGVYDGTSSLNIAALAGETGLPGGVYNITIEDEYSVCSISEQFVLSDPSPIIYNITTASPQTLCDNEDLTLSLNGSQNDANGPVTYTVYRNGNPTTVEQLGDGSPPTIFTVPSSIINNGDIFTIVASNDLCTPAEMSGSITVQKLPELVITSDINHVSCFDAADGSGSFTAGGGSGSGYDFTVTSNTTGAVVNTASNPATFSNAGPGEITIRLRDNQGCETFETVTINEPADLTVSNSGNISLSCFGDENGSGSFTASGGTSPYSFSTDTNTAGAALVQNDNSYTFTGAGVGEITVISTDANGCTETSTITITQPANVLELNNSGDISLNCFGDLNGAGTFTASGGTTPYTFEVIGDANSATFTQNIEQYSFTGAGVGSITVEVTDANGCTTTSSLNITQPATAINLTNSGNIDLLCFGDSDGSGSFTASGGVAPYTFIVTGNSANATTSDDGITLSFTGASAGAINVTVEDANGCSVAGTIVIDQPSQLVLDNTGDFALDCFGDTSGSGSFTASGGTTSYSFNVVNNTSNATINTGTNPVTFTDAGVGEITVEVTDANNCTTSSTVTITQPGSALTLTNNGNVALSCFGDTNGAGTFSAGGGTGSYSFDILDNSANATINTGSNFVNFNNAGVGTVIIEVTDTNGCTATSTATITQPANPLTLSNSGDISLDCFGETNGSGSFTAGGGTAPYTFDVTSNSTGASVNASGNQLTFTGAGAGSISISVTDANGCSETSSINVSQPDDALALSNTGNISLNCFGENSGSGNFSANGGTAPYTFSITGNSAGADISINAEDVAFINAGAGTISISVTDANNCSVSSTVTITQPSSGLSLTTSGNIDLNCFGEDDGTGSFTAAGGTAPYTFIVASNTSGADINLSANPVIFSNAAVGEITVTVRDANNCEVTSTINVSQPAEPLLLSNTGDIDLNCFGTEEGTGSFTASGGTAPYNFNIISNTSGASVNTGASTFSFSGAGAGTIEIEVTDANGCTAASIINITQPADAISISNTGNVDLLCNGDSNGSGTFTVTGGVEPYDFEIESSDGDIIVNETSNTLSFTDSGAGTVKVTVTDANGCSAISTISISQPSLLALSNSGDINLSCFGDADGSGEFTATGGTAPYTFTVDPAGITTSQNNNVLGFTDASVGTVSVTVTDANNCTATSELIITAPEELLLVNSGDITLNCAGDSDGVGIFTASGGTGDYEFTITNTTGGSVNESDDRINVINAGVGEIAVTVTDQNGCTATSTLTIDGPVNPVTLTTSGNIVLACNGDADGTGSFSATGGDGNYTFTEITNTTGATIDANSNPVTFTGAGVGSITFSVEDGNGCTSTATIDVTEPDLLILSSSGNALTSCNGADDASGSFTASGGSGSYTFTVNTDTDADVDLLSNPVTFSNAGPGTIEITVTDENGCSTTSSILITEPESLTVDADVNTITGCNIEDASIDITVNGGTAPYTYEWTDGESTEDRNGLGAGNYELTVTDANGCTFTWATEIEALNPPVINMVETATTTCGGNDGALLSDVTGGTPPFTYSWDNGGTTADLMDIPAGEYTLTVTDANGCTDTAVGLVNDPVSFTVAPVISNVSTCGGNDGAIELNITGGVEPFTFNWSNGESTQNINDLLPGEYTVEITDAGNCTFIESFTITEPEGIILNATVTNVSSCGAGDGSIDLIVSGGTAPFTFQWDSGEETEDLSGLGEGEFGVVVTDAAGCSAELQVPITEPAGFTVVVDFGNVTSCNGNDGLIDLTVSGGTEPFTYLWEDGETSEDRSGLPAGSYSVTVTDATGCSVEIEQEITAPPAIMLNANITDVSVCAGSNGAIDLIVTGGVAPYTYEWDYNNASSEDLINIPGGEYTVQVTDANGCSENLNVTVAEPEGFTILADITEISSCGEADGAIDITVTGGTAPFTFNWNNNSETTEDLSGLSANGYNLIVTDASGCSVSESFVLNDPASFTVTADISNVSTCGGNDGAIDITVTGATTPVIYEWSNGETTEDITNLGAGDYTVTVTDGTGCSIILPVEIDAPEGFTLSRVITNVSSCGAGDGNIDLSVEGGAPPFIYEWSNNATTEDITSLIPGNYSVTVTDANGCTESISAVVTEPAGFSLSTNVTGTSACGGADGAINLTVSGGVAPFTYNWSIPQTGEDVFNLSEGNYSVVVTDANGCSVSIAAFVSDPVSCGGASCSLFSVNFDNTLPTCGEENGVVDINGLTYNGNPINDYRLTLYRIEENDTILDIQVPNPVNGIVNSRNKGRYLYEILDFNTNLTCEGAFDLPFQTAVSADTVEGSVQDVVCFGSSDGAVRVSVSGSSTGQYYYSVDGGDSWSLLPGSRVASGLSAGFNTVMIGEEPGDVCPAEVYVMVDSEYPDVKITRNVTPATCDNNDGSIQITSVAGGSELFDYRFNGEFMNDLPVDGLFDNLDGGEFLFTVIDETTNCEKDFAITVPFPGLVQFTTNVIAPDCSDGNPNNGEIELSIHSAGIFKVGISDELNTDPAEFYEVISEGDGSVIHSFENLERGNYYITVVASGEVCPNRRLVEMQEGPQFVDFTPVQLCQDNMLSLQLEDVTGERNSPLMVEIYKDGRTNPSLTENFAGIPAGDLLVIEDLQSRLGVGNFRVRIVQEQSTCPSGQAIESALKPFIVKNSLIAEVMETTISLPYPEMPDGTITIGNFGGGEPAYVIAATLDSAASAMQSYISDFDTVRLNNNFQYEYVYEDMPAGRYAITVMDSLGCTVDLVARVKLNTNLFIPNVFTPNGDGKNDVFFVRNLPDTGAELVVTNRWGKVVFSSSDYQNNWAGDGTLEGVYFYKLKADGEVYNGWLQIVLGRAD